MWLESGRPHNVPWDSKGSVKSNSQESCSSVLPSVSRICLISESLSPFQQKHLLALCQKTWTLPALGLRCSPASSQKGSQQRHPSKSPPPTRRCCTVPCTTLGEAGPAQGTPKILASAFPRVTLGVGLCRSPPVRDDQETTELRLQSRTMTCLRPLAWKGQN